MTLWLILLALWVGYYAGHYEGCRCSCPKRPPWK